MNYYKIYLILSDNEEKEFQVSDSETLSIPELLKEAFQEFNVMFPETEKIKLLKTIIIQDFSKEIFRLNLP